MKGISGTTIFDVARRAGVSKTTVANVLGNVPGTRVSEDTRQRVLRAASALGYRRNGNAVALASGRSYTIGVVLDGGYSSRTTALSRLYADNALVSLTEAAARERLQVTIFLWDSTAAEPLGAMVDRRADGLVLVSIYDNRLRDLLNAVGVPWVEMGSAYGPHAIRTDNEGGIHAALDHLKSLGHSRRILYWSGPAHLISAQQRRDAFQKRGGDWPICHSREEVAKALSAAPGRRPTAVLCFNDSLAAEVYDIAREIGLHIPRDLSVIGFDNNIVAELLRPALTTVQNPVRALAHESVALLKTLWESGENERVTEEKGAAAAPPPPPVPTHLVVRDSTGPAPE